MRALYRAFRRLLWITLLISQVLSKILKIEGKLQSSTCLNLHDQFLFISLNSLKIKVIWIISESIFIKIATNSCPFYFNVLGDHKGSFQTESKDMDNGYAIQED